MTPLAGSIRTAPAPPSAAGRDGLVELSALLSRVVPGVLRDLPDAAPLPAGRPPAVLAAVAAALGPAEVPREGIGAEAALELLTGLLVRHGLDLSHPHAAAHLQPPVLAVAAVGDAVAGAANNSVDTYDSGPSAIAIERWVIAALAELADLPSTAGGVLTPGGSLSNLMGLLLARDHAAMARGVSVRRDGVAGLGQPVVLVGESSHFSVHRACAALGLGESSVRHVALDSRRRMRPDSLAGALAGLSPDEVAVAVVATAGSTDFGAVDPLPELAAVARAYRVWLHVDAAYGFGALFSPALAEGLPGLAGLGLADSITLDLHKLGWQPAPASVLLVADAAAFDLLEREVAYLNPDDDTADGYGGLLGHSLQTTRRADAVKIAATFLALGRDTLAELVEGCHRLATHAQARIESEQAFELVGPAELTTVVFRYLPRRSGSADALNGALRRRLLRSGSSLVGRTEARCADGTVRTCLKLTLVNPAARYSDIDALLDAVMAAGIAEETTG